MAYKYCHINFIYSFIRHLLKFYYVQVIQVHLIFQPSQEIILHEHIFHKTESCFYFLNSFPIKCLKTLYTPLENKNTLNKLAFSWC